MGVVGQQQEPLRRLQEVINLLLSGSVLERRAREGESPVREKEKTSGLLSLSTPGHVEPWGKQGGPPSKAKYPWRPIVHKYREGKVKRTPVRGVK